MEFPKKQKEQEMENKGQENQRSRLEGPPPLETGGLKVSKDRTEKMGRGNQWNSSRKWMAFPC